MKEETVGSAIWHKRLSPEQVRSLRNKAKAALAKAGTPREQRTNREADRFLESRNRSTIDRWK